MSGGRHGAAMFAVFCVAAMGGVLIVYVILWMTGCAYISPLPTPPPVGHDVQCPDLQTYADQLENVYLARADENRLAIYGAEAVGIACSLTVGGEASMGHGAASSQQTIEITSAVCAGLISFLALFNNAALADLYTVAAGQVALASAHPANCDALDAALTQARIDLERARNGAASASMMQGLEMKP